MTAEPTPTRRPRRWPRRLLVLGGILLVLFLFRAPLLRGVAAILISEDSPQPADTLVVLTGDNRIEEVARRYRESPEPRPRVLVSCNRPDRIERAGLSPDWVAVNRRDLGKHDVPDAAIEVLERRGRSAWSTVRVLGEWLRDHPSATVAMTCDQFESRYLRHILDRELGPDAARVRLLAMPPRRYGRTDWWTNEDGRRSVFFALVRLGFLWTYGEGDSSQPEWNPDAFEAGLKS